MKLRPKPGYTQFTIRLDREDEALLLAINKASGIPVTAIIRSCVAYIFNYHRQHGVFPEGFMGGLISPTAPVFAKPPSASASAYSTPASSPHILNEPPIPDPVLARKSKKN